MEKISTVALEMEITDPNFVVKRPKKERSPAQVAAQQKAFAALKAKRDAAAQENDEVVAAKIVEKRRAKRATVAPAVAAPAAPAAAPVAPAPAPAAPAAAVPAAPDMNAFMSAMTTFMSATAPVKKKKKVVVVEESSESEEEVVIKKPKAKVVAAEPVAVEKPVEKPAEKPRSTGSRVLDNLFLRK